MTVLFAATMLSVCGGWGDRSEAMNDDPDILFQRDEFRGVAACVLVCRPLR
ncbi:MAG: hypothetical protein LBV38_02050 [Alistipes sp.]|nr:hypothetical protein [Alistipes sp.]